MSFLQDIGNFIVSWKKGPVFNSRHDWSEEKCLWKGNWNKKPYYKQSMLCVERMCKESTNFWKTNGGSCTMHLPHAVLKKYKPSGMIYLIKS